MLELDDNKFTDLRHSIKGLKGSGPFSPTHPDSTHLKHHHPAGSGLRLAGGAKKSDIYDIRRISNADIALSGDSGGLLTPKTIGTIVTPHSQFNTSHVFKRYNTVYAPFSLRRPK